MSETTTLNRIFYVALLCIAISGCGVSYSVQPGRLLLIGDEDLSISGVRGGIGPFLEAEGFDDLGLDEEMISLMEGSSVAAERTGFGVDLLRHQYTYLNERRDLRVVLTDYTDATRRRPTLAYEEPAQPFFELSVYESRPGGMSTAGHRFFADFQRVLEKTFDASVVLGTSPPDTDATRYWLTTLSNLFGAMLWWAIVFGIVSVITASLSTMAFRVFPAPTAAKRGIFVLVNTWLATPLPFPATILVILLPHLFAFPWTSLDYYQRVFDFAAISFAISLILSSVISLRVFR